MVLDFAGIPPEINSALMYSGAGSGPLMAAAASYNNLAAELSTTATSWESIITNLTTQSWRGAGVGGAAAAAAALCGVAGHHGSRARARGRPGRRIGGRLRGGVCGHGSPSDRRCQQSYTVGARRDATSWAINTPAIAATEAHYAEMWVQDATAMYTYAAAATSAAALQPLTPASPTSSPVCGGYPSRRGSRGHCAADFHPSLWDALPNSVQTLPNSVDSAYGTPFITNFIQQIGVTAAWFVGNTIPTVASYAHTIAAAEAAAPAAAASSVTPVGGMALPMGSLVSSVGSGGGLGGAVSAGLGEAGSVGGLSVPASWSAAAPATLESSTAPLAGSGWTAGVEETAGSGGIVPGMPGMAGAAKGAGGLAGPRYGIKPIVMPKPVGV